MIIIEVKDSETIDKALRRYKKKGQKTGILSELRRRKDYTKPSVERRKEIMKAAYIQKKYGNN
ncbi:MAG: 30S ribosomal protein S21 [Chitinophagales bacterium]